MTDAEILAAQVFGIIYGVLLAVGLVSTAIRAVRISASRESMPRLLGRDLALILGHAISFTGFMWLITHHEEHTVLDDPFWWLVTAVPAVCSMAIYVYYELFVIGQ